jgi:predicted nucleic acid-binding protein
MSAVSNTSPLRYFVAIGQADLIHTVLGHITIPEAVAKELSHSSAPLKVREWITSKPNWLSIRTVGQDIDPRLIKILDDGESEAIQLALAMRPDFLLIDERLGRREATNRGLNVIGALGVLREASRLGHIKDPLDVLARLLDCGFRLSKRLIREFETESSGM